MQMQSFADFKIPLKAFGTFIRPHRSACGGAKAQLCESKRAWTVAVFFRNVKKLLHQIGKLTKEGEAILSSSFEKLGLSARAYDRILRLARTIADLEDSEAIEPEHVAEAIQYRNLDKKSM
jgi:predicted ATPase with chaperone activity